MQGATGRGLSAAFSFFRWNVLNPQRVFVGVAGPLARVIGEMVDKFNKEGAGTTFSRPSLRTAS